MLEIRLLGAFELRCGGKPIDMPSRAAQSLFAYLVLNRGTPHRRERLAGMFWPDSSEERARASLRHELWRIRKALAAAGQPDALLADDITVAFAPPSKYLLDVACFEQAADDASAEQLMQALSAYGGELLPGFYDDWAVVEREHLHHVFERRVEQLLGTLEAEQRWSEAIEWSERWISLGQNPEAAHRALIAAYAALGDRAKLRAAYERCAEALHALGLAPPEEIQALDQEQQRPTNLPAALTSLIGRQAELEEIAGLLKTSRLVTLTGAGGVGKTRLAIEAARAVADKYPDGVWLLELASVRDPDLVPERLLTLLPIPPVGRRNQTVIEHLVGYFRGRRVLLITDNCEHLIDACAGLVRSLLLSCPALQVIATSRESLGIEGEIAYRVPSLELPSADDLSDPEKLRGIASVRLFAERAQARSREFTLTLENVRHVAAICIRLDGIPLAIELAAARIGTLPLQAIEQRLTDRFALLSSGLRSDVPRHKTLHALIDWSYELLSEPERVLLRRLSVFVGGWTLDAAEKTVGEGVLRGNDVLALLPALVEKSLVLFDASTGRYGMLETVREYALERLRERSEEAGLRDRHLDYFMGAAEAAEVIAKESESAHAQLAAERDNLLAALAWCEHCEDGVQKGLLLVGAARLTWLLLAEPELGYRYASKFLSLPGAETRNLARRRALLTMAHAGIFVGYVREALPPIKESIEIAREIGDGRGEAIALNLYGGLLAEFGELDEAIDRQEHALRIALELDLRRLVSAAYGSLGEVYQMLGELDAAQRLHDQSIDAIRQTNAPHDLILCLLSASQSGLLAGKLEPVRDHLLEALALMCQIPYGLTDAAPPLRMCAAYLAAAKDWRHAAVLFGAAERQRVLENRILESGEKTVGDPLREQSRDELGEGTFEAAYAEGYRMPTRVAVAEAEAWLAAQN